jgi:hypothetical protein
VGKYVVTADLTLTAEYEADSAAEAEEKMKEFIDFRYPNLDYQGSTVDTKIKENSSNDGNPTG